LPAGSLGLSSTGFSLSTLESVFVDILSSDKAIVGAEGTGKTEIGAEEAGCSVLAP